MNSACMKMCLTTLLVLGCVAISSGSNVTFIALGDWGDTLLPGQEQVADRMATWAEYQKPSFIMSTGDNFYPNGVRSVDDIQFDNKWRYVYNHSSLAELPWYLTVGNHDYGRDRGEEWNQVAFSEVEERWNLPHLWYSFYVDIDSERKVHFIAIDSECLRKEVNNHTELVPWLEEELSNSEGHWKIVVGHRPIYSVGDYGPWSGTMEDQILPVLERHGAHMYLCGHDHNLQLLHHQNGTGMEFAISAGGGALWYRYDEEAEEILLRERGIASEMFELTWGFMGVILSEDKMYLEYVNNEGEIFFTYERDWW